MQQHNNTTAANKKKKKKEKHRYFVDKVNILSTAKNENHNSFCLSVDNWPKRMSWLCSQRKCDWRVIAHKSVRSKFLLSSHDEWKYLDKNDFNLNSIHLDLDTFNWFPLCDRLQWNYASQKLCCRQITLFGQISTAKRIHESEMLVFSVYESE